MSDFKTHIAKVANGTPLTFEEARAAFDVVMSGQATPSQIGGFLMALRVRGETVEEISGAVATMRAKMLAVEAPHAAAPDIVAWACIAWCCGCLAFAALLAWRQRRFVRGLGRIADHGEGWLLADAIAGLPAVIGVWKPRIVMPADALSRYDAAERALMLAHEREHIARGDLSANACVASASSMK